MPTCDQPHRLRQPEQLAKAMGRACFAGDFPLPGAIHLRLVRSMFPGARLTALDTSQAEREPGVARVITRRDIAGPNRGGFINGLVYDHPVLVGVGEIMGNGSDAVALIAAESEQAARRAARLVRMEAGPQLAPHDVDQALAWGREPTVYRELKQGDFARAAAQADLVLEHEVDTPHTEHLYMEPENGLAYMDENGMITVWAGSQDPRLHQLLVSRALGLPAGRIHILSPLMGGAFGGKHSLSVHPYLALAVLLLGRPARMRWDRAESLAFSCKKQRLHTRVKLALKDDGTLLGIWARVDGPCSPYTEKSLVRLNGQMKAIIGPYSAENLDLEGRMYATTCPEIGALRGVGGPDGAVVIETALDKAARRLGLTPLQIRQRNWLRENRQFALQYPGAMSRNVSPRWAMEQVTERLLAAAGERPVPRAGRVVGRGLCCAMPGFGTGKVAGYQGLSVHISVELDGSVTVQAAQGEAGQGLAQVIRSCVQAGLGVDPSCIQVRLGDGHAVANPTPLSFSQTALCIAAAIAEGCAELRKQLLAAAGQLLGRPGAALALRHGQVLDEAGQFVLAWPELADYCYRQGIKLGCLATGAGAGQPGCLGVTPLAGLADVEVDLNSGDIRVLRLLCCHDTGTALDRAGCVGQLQGGLLMGVGIALMEEFAMERGFPRHSRFSDYAIPTMADLPGELRALLYEDNPASGLPHGMKGLGEHGVYVAAAALSNAVYDAAGVSLTRFPLTPEKLLHGLGRVK